MSMTPECGCCAGFGYYHESYCPYANGERQEEYIEYLQMCYRGEEIDYGNTGNEGDTRALS